MIVEEWLTNLRMNGMQNETFLPYGKQLISQDDIDAVVGVMRSDWLTQGPAVPQFEDALAEYVGASSAVSCANGTAALHLAVAALGIGPGDKVITSTNTFVASANCAQYVGAETIFADIDPATGLIDVAAVERILIDDRNQKIKAIIPVHFAGQPADLPKLAELARRHGAWIIDDACHALGASYEHAGTAYHIGSNPHTDLTVFSFHPVKHITTGEGGALTTNHAELAERLKRLRSHGIERQNLNVKEMAHDGNGLQNPWYYEMTELGFNYRLTDMQAALGKSQLRRLPQSILLRRDLAAKYRQCIAEKFPGGEVRPLEVRADVDHAYHLYVVRISFDQLGISRARVMNRLRSHGIGTQVHYIPVHLQPYYRRVAGTAPGNFPQAESYYAEALSLPMFPELTEADIQRVVEELALALKPSRATRPQRQSVAVRS